MNPALSRQKGLTLISFIVVFIVLGFFLLLLLKIGPIYLEHYKVQMSLEGVKKEPGVADKSPREILAMLQKRWDINEINDITVNNSVTLERRPGEVKLIVDYEREEPILGNVSALVKFKDEAILGGSN